MIFQDAWHDVFRVKRQIMHSPPLGVNTSVTLHRNSFRVDTVPLDVDGVGVENSMDCVLFCFFVFWEMASFFCADTCTAWMLIWIRCTYFDAPWERKRDRGESVKNAEQVEDKYLDDWRHKMFDSTRFTWTKCTIIGQQKKETRQLGGYVFAVWHFFWSSVLG